MNTKYIWIALVVVTIIAVIGIFTPLGQRASGLVGSVGITSNTNFQGVVGAEGLKVGSGCKDSASFTYCTGVAIQGGTLSTTTGASMTLAPTDLGYGTILMNPTVAAVTITLPATTTSGMSSFLPNVGDWTSMVLVNSTTTAVSITLAGGTGTILTDASTTKAIIGGGNQGMSLLEFVRKANTDIGVLMVPGI